MDNANTRLTSTKHTTSLLTTFNQVDHVSPYTNSENCKLKTMTDASSTKCLQPAQGSITTDTMQCILQSHSHTSMTKVHLYSNNQLTINNYKQTSNTICKIEPLKSTSNHESNFSEKWPQIQILNLWPKNLATNSN